MMTFMPNSMTCQLVKINMRIHICRHYIPKYDAHTSPSGNQPTISKGKSNQMCNFILQKGNNGPTFISATRTLKHKH